LSKRENNQRTMVGTYWMRLGRREAADERGTGPGRGRRDLRRGKQAEGRETEEGQKAASGL
jgi:hypothetical protein